MLERLGCNGKVRLALGGKLRNLHGRALMHVQRDIRVAPDKGVDHGGQRVSRLRMGRCETQFALLLISKFISNPFNTADLI